MNYRKGFTLLELLIVVAIIGILLSLFLPSLSSARYMARIAVCASSVKQNGTAMVAYTVSNDGHVPTRGIWTSPQYHRYFYVSNINDYSVLGKVWQEGFLTNPESFFCAEANIVRAGTYKSYDFYVKDGEFQPVSVVNSKGTGAARSNYIFYPYQTSSSNWDKLLLSRMDSEAMFFADDLWTISHNRAGQEGWNVSRVDMSIKFIKSQSAFSYMNSISSEWSDWPKTSTIRDFLIQSF